MRVTEFLKPEAIVAELTSSSKSEVLKELAQALSKAAPQVAVERLWSVLDEREKIGSTGMEKGVAIPHGRLPELSTLVASFGVSRAGVNFEARDARPSQFFFALVAPENSAGVHLKALSKISRLFRSDALREALLAAKTPEEIYELISQEDSRS
jgi:PTS system nitrogen regulatory IIA component